MTLRSDIRADFDVAVKGTRNPGLLRTPLLFVKHAGFRACVLYRIGNRLRTRGHRILGGVVEHLMHLLSHTDISTTASIGPGLNVPHPQAGVVIGNKCTIGARAYILQGVTLGGRGGASREDGQTQPRLGDDVLVGAGPKILGPVRIGNNVKIGANAVVLQDLPDDSIAVGVPARIVRVGDRKLSLLESGDELAEMLGDIVERLERLESLTSQDTGGTPPERSGSSLE